MSINYKKPVILTCLLTLIQSISLSQLTRPIFTQTITKQLNNTHYFIVTSRPISSAPVLDLFRQLGQAYPDSSIQVYECNPSELKDLCSTSMPIYLVINTVRIEYNGRENNLEDMRKWVRFRLEEMPTRVHSVQELRQYVGDKNEVFCYVDKEGQETTRKQYIFIGTAKKFHFLYYCLVDSTIGREIGLKYGHLALVRRDLSFNFDYWSEKVPEQFEQLHTVWQNFLLRSYESDVRLLNRNKNNDLVTIECDLSLQCEEDLQGLLAYELKWRQKHPDLNFKIRLFHGFSGEIKSSHGHNHDLPIIKYGRTQVSSRIVRQKSGAYIRQTHYQRDTFMQTKAAINEDTIEVLLHRYENKQLQFVIRDVDTEIVPLERDSQDWSQVQVHNEGMQDL